MDIWGGVSTNVVPEKAGATVRAILRTAAAVAGIMLRQTLTVEQNCENGYSLLAAGSAGHTAFPQHTVNAIHILTHALCESNALLPEDTRILSFFDRINDGCCGPALGIDFEDDVSGKLTCVWIDDRDAGRRAGSLRSIFDIRLRAKLTVFWKICRPLRTTPVSN